MRHLHGRVKFSYDVSNSQEQPVLAGGGIPFTNGPGAMSNHRRAMFLVKSSAMSGGRYKTGEEIPSSGVYRVTHSAHRLPHEVMLLRGEKFPKCQACSDPVAFRLLRAAKETTRGEKRLTFNVALYEIPVLDDDDMAVQTAI